MASVLKCGDITASTLLSFPSRAYPPFRADISTAVFTQDASAQMPR